MALTATLLIAADGAAFAASVSGRSFEDAGGDGSAQAGDRGLQGATVYVDVDDDGEHDAGEPTATTGSGGSWQIDGLAAGTHLIRQVAEAGWTCSAPADCVHTVDLGSGDAATGRDFGWWRAGRILGTAFEDRDRDGRRDIAEPASVRRVVYLDLDGDAVKDLDEPSTASGVDGSYSFNGLPPGAWVVRQVLGEGWHCSVPVPCAYTVKVRSGDEHLSRDFGSWNDATFGPITGIPVLMVGTPTLQADGADIVQTRDEGAGEDVFTADGVEGCLPLRVQVPIAIDRGEVEAARLVLRSADSEDTVALADAPPEPADGFWSGTMPCARTGALELVVTATSGETRTPLGRLVVNGPAPQPDPEPEPEPEPQPDPEPEPEPKPSSDDKPACLMRPVSAAVRGRLVRRVLFYLDGRRVKTVSRRDARGRFAFTVDRRRLGPGKHMLRAKVVFVRRAKRRPAFLSLPIKRCAAAPKSSKAVTAKRLSRCVAGPFKTWVRGGRIHRVRFSLHGRSLGRAAVADWRGRYRVTVDPRRLGPGRHVLKARVEFDEGSGLRDRTLRLPFTNCS